MSLRTKQVVVAALSLAVALVLGYVVVTEKEHTLHPRKVVVKPDSAGCVACHGGEDKGGSPGIVRHWEASAHATQGVGCMDCHGLPRPGEGEDLKNPRYVVKTSWDKGTGRKAEELAPGEDKKPLERPDVWRHEGADIVVNVSPRTCARCHETEAAQFFHSRHHAASQFIGSLDNFLGRFAEGPAAANSGCQQCHGSAVRLVEPARDGKAPVFSADTWPNTGVGRQNLDGSWGSCSACHSRHEFSAETARRPENCGKCHMGPDHPQVEIFQESKHGITFRKSERHLGLDRPGGDWILGRDYAQAPSCSSCHMGPVAPHGNHPGLGLTHDVGARISWTLRPEVSFQPREITAADGTVLLKPPAQRRADMQQACTVCHSGDWVRNFYVQYDQAVELYNEKFARPSKAIYEFLATEKILDDVPMNEQMDYVYFELWHHEGRRARHGASMMGPDYVQWHGFYELSRNFYTHFLPLARELAEKAGKGEKAKEFIEKTLQGQDGKDWEKHHRWTKGLSPEQRKSMLEWERQNYDSRK